MIGSTLKNCELCNDTGILYAIGYKEDNAYVEYSMDDGATNATYISGATQVLIGPCDDDRPAITQKSSGVLVAAVVDSGIVKIYRSEDFGESWFYVEDVGS